MGSQDGLIQYLYWSIYLVDKGERSRKLLLWDKLKKKRILANVSCSAWLRCSVTIAQFPVKICISFPCHNGIPSVNINIYCWNMKILFIRNRSTKSRIWCWTDLHILFLCTDTSMSYIQTYHIDRFTEHIKNTLYIHFWHNVHVIFGASYCDRTPIMGL